MERTKKVSIILPVYNGADSVSDSIDSILNQTYNNLELIIVNDCSTDETAQLIEKYAKQDARIITIHNKVNRKLPRSLNIGFQEATGEYLTWTSDDNMYRESAIEHMVNALECTPDAGMVYADYTIVNELLGEIKTSVTVVSEPEALRLKNVVGACFLYKRDVAEKTGIYDPEMFLAEDYDYWIRIWRNAKCITLHENLYIYRLQANGLTATRSEAVRTQAGAVISKHFNFLYSTCNTDEEKTEFFDNLMSHMADEKKRKELKRIYGCMPSYKSYYMKKIMKAKLWDIVHGLKSMINNQCPAGRNKGINHGISVPKQ